MAEFVAFGDAEAAVVDILSHATQLSAFSATVAPDLVGYGAGSTWLRVTRTGGTPALWMRLDKPRIQIDVLAPTKATAHDLAQAARGAVFAARGEYTGQGLALCDVADSMGLAWLPDPDEPLVSRYTFALDLTTRPL